MVAEQARSDVLEARDVVKEFPGVRALDHIDFDAHTGEIHAIVGANGAGKSTLAKILAGVSSLDCGQLLLNGQEIYIDSPLTAKSFGIAMAPQEVDNALVPILSVGENILLDHLARQRTTILNWQKLYSDAEQLAQEVGLDVRMQTPISQLSISQRQKAVIAQALAKNARFLILDEPTSSLSLPEVEELFTLLRSLVTKQRLCIIYISHRMPEVFSIANRITVMRDGRKVGTMKSHESSIDEVVFMMLNRRREAIKRIPRSHGPDKDSPPLFKADGLKRGRVVKKVSFELHTHEVLALAGLVGAGKTETIRLLFGADQPEDGRLYLHGKQVQLHQPADAVKKGICLVPEDHRRQGVLTEFPIAQNVTLPHLEVFTQIGLVQPNKEKAAAEAVIQRLQIKCRDCAQQVKFLSGGNQQKVSIGKWLVEPGSVFIFDELTKGIDVGAKEEVLKIIAGLADAGAGVVYSSSELAEVLRISDRIIVMFDGQIVAELDAQSADEEQLLLYASGG
jgi:simple sugar transport system ATP-binding protein